MSSAGQIESRIRTRQNELAIDSSSGPRTAILIHCRAFDTILQTKTLPVGSSGHLHIYRGFFLRITCFEIVIYSNCGLLLMKTANLVESAVGLCINDVLRSVCNVKSCIGCFTLYDWLSPFECTKISNDYRNCCDDAIKEYDRAKHGRAIDADRTGRHAVVYLCVPIASPPHFDVLRVCRRSDVLIESVHPLDILGPTRHACASFTETARNAVLHQPVNFQLPKWPSAQN